MSEFTFATVQRAFAEAMARPPIAADEARALAAVAEAEGKPCVLPADLIARLEAEARAVLREVEPRNAALDRANHGWAFAFDEVAIASLDGRRVEKITRAEWAARWRSDPVPPLPTRGVANAGGVACIVAWTEDVEARTSILARTNNVYWSNGFAATAPIPTAMRFMQMHDSAWEKAGRPQGEAAKSWYRSRAEARDYPAERGWCSGLGASEEQAKRGTAAGWRLLCGVLRSVLRETDAAWTAERAEIVRAKGEG